MHASVMKNVLVLATVVLFSATSTAADILVGAQLEVPDLQSALAIAHDGDRILVQPGRYFGDVYIDKAVTILPAQEGTRFTLDNGLAPPQTAFSNVLLGPALNGKTLTISGCRSSLVKVASGTMTSPTYVRLMDCRIKGASLSGQGMVRLSLLRDSILEGTVTCHSAEVIGCYLRESQGNFAAIWIQQPSGVDEDNYIIGNFIWSLDGAFMTKPMRPFHFENNCVVANIMLYLAGGTAGQAPCTVLNNTFFKDGYSILLAGPYILGSVGLIGTVTPCPANILVKNNARATYPGITPSFLYENVEAVLSSHNIDVPVAQLDLNTGQPLPGSVLINAGDPDPRYLDLDLTQNDVGCYGGSNSRANFTTPMGSAVVGFMRAPRIVSQGSPVNVSAVGFDR